MDEAGSDAGMAKVRKRRTTLPVRRRRKGSYLTVTGKFCSLKSIFLVAFEGFRERDFFVLLEYNDRVLRYRAHPFTLRLPTESGFKKYTPDVLVEFHPGADGKTQLPEVCEVKLQRLYEKEKDSLDGKFVEVEKILAAKGRRFRLVTDVELRQPMISNLYFLLAYRRREEMPKLANAIAAVLVTGHRTTAQALIAQVVQQGFDALEVTSELWRALATGTLSTDFDRPLTMMSPIWKAPWTVEALLSQAPAPQPTVEIDDMANASEQAKKHAAQLEDLSTTPVSVVLRAGEIYTLRDTPGSYRLVHFKTTEVAIIEEVGSGALSECPTDLILPITVDNRERRALHDLTPEQRQTADRILESIKPFLDGPVRIDPAISKREAAKFEVSQRTWREWVLKYRRNPSLTTLIRSPRSDRGQSRFPKFVEDTMKEFVGFWLSHQNSPISTVHGDLKAAIELKNEQARTNLPIPDYTTFFQRCRNVPEHQRVIGRSGARAARLSHGLTRGAMKDIFAPLSWVQIDHTELNVEIVDEEFREPCGRPWITVAIDLFSRMIVGFYVSLQAPGNLALGRAMVHLIQPKAPYLAELEIDAPWPCSGYPVAVHADNAGEFQGNMMELAAREHTFDLYFRKVKHPNYGGHIENYLGKLSQQIKTLPGWVAQSAEERGEHSSAEDARLTLRDLEQWLVRTFAAYHAEPHSSLNEQSPLNRWRDGCQGTMTTPGLGVARRCSNPTQLHLDFLPIEERVVDSTGIVLDYIHYQSPHLQKWVGARAPGDRRNPRKFHVRRDPRDLSVIYFWDPDDKRYYAIPYRTPTRPRITLWELQQIRKIIKARNLTDIDEDLIFRLYAERRTALKQAAASTEKRRQAKAQEARRLALEHASRQQAAIANDVQGLPAPVVADVDSELLPAEHVTSIEDVF